MNNQDDAPPSYTAELRPLDSQEDYVVVDPERMAVDTIARSLCNDPSSRSSTVAVDSVDPPTYSIGRYDPSQESASLDEKAIILNSVFEQDRDAKGSSSESAAQPIVKHFVQSTDTLFGLSLKYNVSVSDLRKANRLYDTDEVIMRTYVYIPSVAQSLSPEPRPEDIKVQLIRRFQLNTECRDGFEAKTYLDLADWDLAKAVESYHSDMNWERGQLLGQGDAATGSSSRNDERVTRPPKPKNTF